MKTRLKKLVYKEKDENYNVKGVLTDGEKEF